MWEPDRHRAEAERQRLERVKSDVERLLKTGQPRQPSGRWWGAMKEAHPDILEQDLKILLAITFDFYFAGAARLQDQARDTSIEIPPTFTSRYLEGAPPQQVVLQLHGQNFVLIEDFVTTHTDETGQRFVKSEEQNWIVGALPGGKADWSLLEDWRTSRDLRKLDHYQEILVLPNAPRQATYLASPMTADESDALYASNPREHDRIQADHNTKQLEHEITSLVGAAWKLRYVLSLWSGVTVTDEQFSKRMLEIADRFDTDPKQADFKWWYARISAGDARKELKFVERLQAGVVIQLAKEQLGAPAVEPVTALVDWDKEPAKRLLYECKDLPGFRYWVGDALGTFKPSGHVPPKDEWSWMREPERPKRPELVMPEVVTRGVPNKVVIPPAQPRWTPPTPRVPPTSPSAEILAPARPALTSADREYLKEIIPPYTPTEYDHLAEKLLLEVRKVLTADRLLLLDLFLSKMATEKKYFGRALFELALLKDVPELRDSKSVTSYPSIVLGTHSMLMALLLGSRHVVDHYPDFPGNAHTNEAWEKLLAELNQVLPNSEFKLEPPGKGLLRSAIGQIDFGSGPEDVLLEAVEHMAPKYGEPDNFYKTRKVPYPRAGLMIDNSIYIEPEEMAPALRLLERGGFFVNRSNGVVKPDWESIAPVEQFVIARGRGTDGRPEERAAVLEHFPRYWAKRGYEMKVLPDCPDLQYTLVQKK